MANTIQIKRHTNYGTDADPATNGGLAYGELAWNNEGKKLWIGRQTGADPTVITSYHLNPDASATVKGLASFDATDFAVTGGAVSIAAMSATLLTGTINNARLSNIPSSALAGSIANSKLANSTIAINSQTASLGGGFTIQGTSNELDVSTSGTTTTLGLPDDVTIGGDLTISGNLSVTGTVDTVSVTDTDIVDKTITLAKGIADAATANGSGITIDKAGASLTYTHSGTKWSMNKPLEVTGTVTATGGNSGNWNTAYTHSQAAHAPTNADATNSTNVAAAGAVMDGDFSSNGILKRTGAGAYSVVTDSSANWNTAYTHSQATHAPTNADNTAANETSHSDVVVDGDFGSNGILTRTSAGNYSAITNSSANWNSAYTDRFKWDGGALGNSGTAATARGSIGVDTSWVQAQHATYTSRDIDTTGVGVIDELVVNNTGHVTNATTRNLSLSDFGTIDGGTVNWS